MRPLHRSLFVFAVFGIAAAHIATGFLIPALDPAFPKLAASIDQALTAGLVEPFGKSTAVALLLGAGSVFAGVAYRLGGSGESADEQSPA